MIEPQRIIPSDTLYTMVTKMNAIIDTVVSIPGEVTDEIQRELNTKASIEYVDSQIALITADGIPKLASYYYTITSKSDGQTVFNIPLETFDKNTDTLLVFQNTTFIGKHNYTINDDKTFTLNTGVNQDTSIEILILKNVPVGPEGSINGNVLAVDSIPMNRIKDLLSTLGNINDETLPVELRGKALTEQIKQLKKDVNDHQAENATEAHDGISILNNNITVTVGDNGDFSTINDALNYLTTKYPAYKSGGNVKATIKLLSGFVMSEQVIVRGLDLGWIEIVGEDAETTIERSTLTINFTIDDYGFDSFPAFGVSKGGTLPIIRQLFVMDNSGDRADRHGIMAVDNSRASILTGCGVQNAGTYGIYATRSSTIVASGADASGAGEHGVCAVRSSTIEAWGADASGAGGFGVYANQASIINAISVNARKGEVDSAEDIYVLNGSIIKIAPTGDNQTIGSTNQDINTLTGNGIIFG